MARNFDPFEFASALSDILDIHASLLIGITPAELEVRWYHFSQSATVSELQEAAIKLKPFLDRQEVGVAAEAEGEKGGS